MAKKQRGGASHKASYKNYLSKNSFLKNKIKRAVRTLKQQPNNALLEDTLLVLNSAGKKYSRNRRSEGHVCKGLYTSLGFKDNKPNENMKLAMHWYYGGNFKKLPSVSKTEHLKHGKSMGEQLVELGYKIPRFKHARKYKKTTR